MVGEDLQTNGHLLLELLSASLMNRHICSLSPTPLPPSPSAFGSSHTKVLGVPQ